MVSELEHGGNFLFSQSKLEKVGKKGNFSSTSYNSTENEIEHKLLGQNAKLGHNDSNVTWNKKKEQEPFSQYIDKKE